MRGRSWMQNTRKYACTVTRRSVILAQARTYNTFPKSRTLTTRGHMLWVPAFAGMTV
jgi:hypothetical protein